LRRSFSFRAISFFDSVSYRPSEPPLVDEEHPAALRLLGDDVLGLTLGSDEQNGSAFGGEVGDELLGLAEQLDRLPQVDDVDAVSFAEDVLLHLRVPAFRLMAEVHPGLHQILHRDSGQMSSPPSAGLKTCTTPIAC
jgi:hypothetical protein